MKRSSLNVWTMLMVLAMWPAANAVASPEPCTDPPIPPFLVASVVANGDVILGWTSDTPGAFSFQITANGGTIATLPGSRNFYRDVAPPACVQRTYQVTANYPRCPSASSNTVTVTPVPIATSHVVADFDGDGRTDISVFHPGASAGWSWIESSNVPTTDASQWGTTGDRGVPGDYDGDGKADPAIFRPSTGEWYVANSCDTSFAVPFGQAGDVPAPADFDGDGKTDVAVFRPGTGDWWVLPSGGGAAGPAHFGQAGDVPVPADFDGDGKADHAVFRPSDENWYIDGSAGQSSVIDFGAAGDVPVPADYDGDGKADVALFRPSDGNWYVLQSSNLATITTLWGLNGDQAAPGDYDGDGKADRAIFRDDGSSTVFWVLRSSGGHDVVSFGAVGDIAVPRLALQPDP